MFLISSARSCLFSAFDAISRVMAMDFGSEWCDGGDGLASVVIIFNTKLKHGPFDINIV